MNDREKERIICRAIKSRSILIINYPNSKLENRERIIEPHQVGELVCDDGTYLLLLNAYFVGGYSESHNQNLWRTYSISKIENVCIANRKFKAPREGYKKCPNKYFKECICEL